MNNYIIKDLRKVIEQRNFTIEGFAKFIGRSRVTVYKYIDNPETIRLGEFIRICSLLNVSVESMIIKQQ